MLDEILNLQDAGARVTVMGDLGDPIYRYSNPSIAYDGKGKLRIVIRSSNFAVKPHGMWYLRGGPRWAHTKNLYGFLDPDCLEISDLKEVQYDAATPRHIADISGLEDARLFWRKDGMHWIGAEVDTRPEHRYPPLQAEFVYDDKTNTLKFIRSMFGESPARGEKNWMPPSIPSKLFEFNYSPTETWSEGSRITGERYQGWIHGGSQLLWQKDSETYIAIVHSKHADPMTVGRVYDKMIFVHYFAEYSKKGLLVRLSEPFTFGCQDYIEFASGMVEHGEDLLITFGIADGRMGFARIAKEKAMSMLTSYSGIEINPLPKLTRSQYMYTERRLYELQTGR